MNAPENHVKEPMSQVDQIRDVINRLKTQAKEKYKKDVSLAETEENYDTSYMRGYYFGQVAALEDCYHLMVTLAEGLKSASSTEKRLLLQQLGASILVVEKLVDSLEYERDVSDNLLAAKEYLASIANDLDV